VARPIVVLVSFAILALTPAGSAAAPSAHASATCSEFATQLAAQQAANTSDPDGDGIYCESLSCPCSAAWHAQHDDGDGSSGRYPASSPDPVAGSTDAPAPGTVRSRVSPLRDPRGLHPGLTRIPRSKWAAARRLIRRVRTANSGPHTGYDRDKFGSAWTDNATNVAWAGNDCGTRDDILQRDFTNVELRAGTCIVIAGVIREPYLPSTITFEKARPLRVQIDHVIALSFAWEMGAATWTRAKRLQLANDPLNLIAVDGPTNGRKGDQGPTDWLPPNAQLHCAYSVRVAQVARKYDLPVATDDKTMMLHECKRGPI
jgi:hypothetical protein